MHKLDKILEKKKKGGKEISDVEKDAKMSVVQHMKELAAGEMSDRLKGMKKVTVASDSTNGLKEGIDKAKSIIDKMGNDQEGKDHDHIVDAAENPLDEAMESDDQEEMEHYSPNEMTEDDIDAKIAKLQQMKKSKSGKI